MTAYEVKSTKDLLASEGGRVSVELGLDLENREPDIDRWFLAATLFGSPIRSSVAIRTWTTLADAGVRTIADAGQRRWDELVELLDRGGYGRYDFRMATRLHDLAVAVTERHQGSIGTLADEEDPAQLSSSLQALPGWGPTTTGIFLRELRGIWPGAQLPIDGRALLVASQVGMDLGDSVDGQWVRLAETADRAGVDPRDLEAALVRRAVRLKLRVG